MYHVDTLTYSVYGTSIAVTFVIPSRPELFLIIYSFEIISIIKLKKWYNGFISQIYLFDAGVGKYLFEAQCSFRYSPPFSSYSALVILLVVNKGDRENFLAPYQASRIGFSGERFLKKIYNPMCLKVKNEIFLTKTSLFLLS